MMTIAFFKSISKYEFYIKLCIRIEYDSSFGELNHFSDIF